jgi:hypothetical protein
MDREQEWVLVDWRPRWREWTPPNVPHVLCIVCGTWYFFGDGAVPQDPRTGLCSDYLCRHEAAGLSVFLSSASYGPPRPLRIESPYWAAKNAIACEALGVRVA